MGLVVYSIVSAVLSSLSPLYGAIVGAMMILLWEIESDEKETNVTKYYSQLNSIVDSSVAENDNYGWIVYTYKYTSDSCELWCTSGKWYWHDPDLKKGEKWWIKLGSILNA